MEGFKRVRGSITVQEWSWFAVSMSLGRRSKRQTLAGLSEVKRLICHACSRSKRMHMHACSMSNVRAISLPYSQQVFVHCLLGMAEVMKAVCRNRCRATSQVQPESKYCMHAAVDNEDCRCKVWLLHESAETNMFQLNVKGEPYQFPQFRIRKDVMRGLSPVCWQRTDSEQNNSHSPFYCKSQVDVYLDSMTVEPIARRHCAPPRRYCLKSCCMWCCSSCVCLFRCPRSSPA